MRRVRSVAQDVRRYIAQLEPGEEFTFGMAKSWVDVHGAWKHNTGEGVTRMLFRATTLGILSSRGEYRHRIYTVQSKGNAMESLLQTLIKTGYDAGTAERLSLKKPAEIAGCLRSKLVDARQAACYFQLGKTLDEIDKAVQLVDELLTYFPDGDKELRNNAEEKEAVT